MIHAPCSMLNYAGAATRRDGLRIIYQNLLTGFAAIKINNMRTILYLILTAFISTGAMFAGLNQHAPVLGYAIGLAAWAIFFWSWYRRLQKNEKS